MFDYFLVNQTLLNSEATLRRQQRLAVAMTTPVAPTALANDKVAINCEPRKPTSHAFSVFITFAYIFRSIVFVDFVKKTFKNNYFNITYVFVSMKTNLDLYLIKYLYV